MSSARTYHKALWYNRLMKKEYMLTLGVLAGSTLDAGCTANQLAARIPQSRPTESAAARPPETTQKEVNPDPIFRAANVILGNQRRRGQGALIDINGTISVYTSYAGAFEIAQDRIPGYIEVPAVGRLNLDPQQFFSVTGPARKENIPTAYYVFQGPEEQKLQASVAAKAIKPLVYAPGKIPIGERVAIPNIETGQYTMLKATEELPASGSIVLDAVQKDAVCTFGTGNPVLRMVDGTITNETWGIMIGVSPGAQVSNPTRGSQLKCYSKVLLLPNVTTP